VHEVRLEHFLDGQKALTEVFRQVAEEGLEQVVFAHNDEGNDPRGMHVSELAHHPQPESDAQLRQLDKEEHFAGELLHTLGGESPLVCEKRQFCESLQSPPHSSNTEAGTHVSFEAHHPHFPLKQSLQLVKDEHGTLGQ